MSSKVTITEVKSSNSQITTEIAPKIAVFVGATSGIGKAALSRLLAQQTAIKVYLIGRNAAKNQALIAQLRETNSKANIIFLEGEVSLLAEVKRICGEIKAKESSIDALYLSTGYIPHAGRESKLMCSLIVGYMYDLLTHYRNKRRHRSLLRIILLRPPALRNSPAASPQSVDPCAPHR